MNIRKKSLSFILVIFLSVLIMVTSILAILDFFKGTLQWIVYISPIIFTILALAYIIFFIHILQKNPTPLRVGLIGCPGSGKTVFLSVFFHEIETFNEREIKFQPYGLETVEEVIRNINLLSSGRWLPRTQLDNVFPFRASASVASGFFTKRYTIDIGDYAGENIKELEPESEQWLHRTKYFDYVKSSDILFLAIDGDQLANKPELETSAMLNILTGALQILLGEKGVQAGKKTNMPVAILILKSDCLKAKKMSETDAKLKIRRLFEIAERRCHKLQTFFVSAVGSIKEDGSPPSQIQPENVCQPMLWALRNLKM